MWYAAHSRLEHQKRQPSFQCGQNSANGYYTNKDMTWVTSSAPYTSKPASKEDRFSKSDANGGNGTLTYPIGLMTADEISFAGGVVGKDSLYVYYILNSANELSFGMSTFWTMTPCGYTSHATVYSVNGNGLIYGTPINNDSTYMRPVISLKSCVTWVSGNGTPTNPYRVSLSDTCASKEN